MHKLKRIQPVDDLPKAETFIKPVLIVVTVTMLATQAQTEYDPYLDVHLITQKSTPLEGRQLCRDLGYDGLAVIRKHKAYQHALSVTAAYRSQQGKTFNIGATLCLSHGKILWDDGKVASDDNYWGKKPPTKKAEKPKVFLGVQGSLWMSTIDDKRASLCGNYEIKPIQGTKFEGQQPEVLNSTLTSVTSGVNYFLMCVSICGYDNSCAAVEFSLDLLTCTTFQAGAYTDLVKNSAAVTFVKN